MPADPSAADLLIDPRWDDDPISLWDELLHSSGYDHAFKVWMQACRQADAEAEASDE